MNPQKNLRILRDPQVFDRTKLSKSTRWRLEKAGLFPKRIHLTQHTVGWLEEQIENWLLERAQGGK